MIVDHRGFTFERPGHATIRIESPSGTMVYIDPWSGVLERRRKDATYVCISHGDLDHYDPLGIEVVSTEDTVIVPYGAVDFTDLWAPYYPEAVDREIRPLAFDAVRTFEDIRFEAVPAYNRADGENVDRTGEPNHARGEVIGLLLTMENLTMYYPADTDFLEEHRGLSADVMFPPIGGRATMDRHEAARFVREVEPELVLPIHYNTGLIWGIEADGEAFQAELEADGFDVRLF